MKNISDLSFDEASRIVNRSSSFKDPKSLYALYFYFEQLGYKNCLFYIYKICLTRSFAPEYELLKARFYLFNPGPEADDFFAQQELFLSGSDLAYFHFLASAYYDKIKQIDKKTAHSNLCLNYYDSSGDFSRYMTALAHKSRMNISDLKKTLEYSVKSKQYKAAGVCYLNIASKYFEDCDYEYGQFYLKQAHNFFLTKHHDPRRIFEVKVNKIDSFIELKSYNSAKNLLTLATYQDSSSIKRMNELKLKYIAKKYNLELPNNQNTIDYKLIQIISTKPISRQNIKDYLWPNHKKMITESIDERLSSAIYRLKTKFNIPIKKENDLYSLVLN